ncbi:MAG: exonuclease SbcCD subunit D C-terminal domain-containing protein, partial [bacterium]|nr:exonuclease SbcCD subunit D C-terminal domain-containing protein [bacterium]
AGLYVRGGYEGIGRVVSLAFDDGPLDLVLLPFLNPQGAPDDLENGDKGHGIDDGEHPLARRQSRTHESVLKAALGIAQQDLQAPRSVAVAHAFVKGGHTSESERLLGVGGAGMVSGKLFSHFSYSALGHLHRPQEALGPTIRYSGSPLPYSFSEVHEKSVTMVEIDTLGECQVRTIPIEVGRRVMTVEGTMEELLSRQPDGRDQEVFVRAIVTDPGTVLDAKARLSQRYPNVVEVNLRPGGDVDSGSGLGATGERHRTPHDATLEFWEEVEQSEPDARTVELLTGAVGDALQEVAV